MAGRAWMLAAVFLLAALMCAQGLVASRSGGRVFPLGWPLSFMPPEGFSPVGSPELPFEAILAYEGSVQGSPPFRVLTGVAPLHSRTVPELTAIQVWAQVQAMAPETQLIDFSPPKPTRLGGRQAWLYGDLATGGAVLRCAAVGDTLAFAAAVTPEGGREQAAKVFDEFCASLRIARGR